VTLTYFDSIVLGIVEGLTEFLPVSSTAHLTVTEKLLGLQVNDPAVTAYTAIIQLGAIGATLIFFARKIVRLVRAWASGLRNPGAREGDYLLAWAVIVGSIPVGVVGFALKDVIEGPLRSLWVVAVSVVLWSGVMVWAERRHDVLARLGRQRSDEEVTIKDALVIGLVQCFSLIPGVSRSGATISAGLARGIDRVSATELSFFMAIPALTAAGAFEAAKTDLSAFGAGQLILGIVIAFVVAYASIAWLLRFVANNSLRPFVWYRVGAGLLLTAALATGLITAT
jgi:undecaprenyl-diphosphatase